MCPSLCPKSEDVQTEPPPRANFSDTVNQWIIYDAYTNYEKIKELQVGDWTNANANGTKATSSATAQCARIRIHS